MSSSTFKIICLHVHLSERNILAYGDKLSAGLNCSSHSTVKRFLASGLALFVCAVVLRQDSMFFMITAALPLF